MGEGCPGGGGWKMGLKASLPPPRPNVLPRLRPIPAAQPRGEAQPRSRGSPPASPLRRPKHKVTGMKGLLRRLDLPLDGTHHLGMDDVDNITKCTVKMLQDRTVLRITGRITAREEAGW